MSKTVCVNDRDVAAFQQLKRQGVELEVRAVPGDLREPLEKFIPQLKSMKLSSNGEESGGLSTPETNDPMRFK